MDKTQAFLWFKRAAAYDNTDAMHKLAICYRLGKGISQDISQTKYWERRRQESELQSSGFSMPAAPVNAPYNAFHLTPAPASLSSPARRRFLVTELELSPVNFFDVPDDRAINE